MIKVGLSGVLEVCGECYTLGKLIGLLFLFCLPLLAILFLKTKRNDLARPVMGTIFLVIIIIIIHFFRRVFLECTEAVALSLIPHSYQFSWDLYFYNWL